MNRNDGRFDPRRRQLALAGALGACLAAWPMAGSKLSTLRQSRSLMGTVVEIAAAADDPARLHAAQAAAFDRMDRLAQIMSHYAPASQVAAIGLAAGLHAVAIEPELMQVLAMAQDVSSRTDGAFDVTVGSAGRWHFDALQPQMPTPAYVAAHLGDVDYRNLVLDARGATAYLRKRGMRLDLGGIAKLYILQAGLDTLRGFGIATALVNGGGDVIAMSDGAHRPWRVGVRDPRQPQRLLGALDVRNGFVASSGDYERFFVRAGQRYHHVLDPRTGYPAQGPHGVTLVGDSLASVNGIGAAAMVLDARRGRELVRSQPGVEALIAQRGGELWMTGGMRQRLKSA